MGSDEIRKLARLMALKLGIDKAIGEFIKAGAGASVSQKLAYGKYKSGLTLDTANAIRRALEKNGISEGKAS